MLVLSNRSLSPLPFFNVSFALQASGLLLTLNNIEILINHQFGPIGFQQSSGTGSQVGSVEANTNSSLFVLPYTLLSCGGEMNSKCKTLHIVLIHSPSSSNVNFYYFYSPVVLENCYGSVHVY